MVVVEEIPCGLSVGSIVDLQFLIAELLGHAVEGLASFELRVVFCVFEGVEPHSVIAVAVEPAQRVSVEGRPCGESVDVRRNGDVHSIDAHGGRLISQVRWVLIGASRLLRVAWGQSRFDRAEVVVGGGTVAVLLGPVEIGGVDVINPDDVGRAIGAHVEHGPWGGADHLCICAAAQPGAGQSAVVESCGGGGSDVGGPRLDVDHVDVVLDVEAADLSDLGVGEQGGVLGEVVLGADGAVDAEGEGRLCEGYWRARGLLPEDDGQEDEEAGCREADGGQVGDGLLEDGDVEGQDCHFLKIMKSKLAESLKIANRHSQGKISQSRGKGVGMYYQGSNFHFRLYLFTKVFTAGL